MSASVYKPKQTHQGTLQVLRVWQLRLAGVVEDLQGGHIEAARSHLHELRDRLQPEAYPEFAENIDWLYRAALAFIDQEQPEEARRIASALHAMLEQASRKLANERSTQHPFPDAEGSKG